MKTIIFIIFALCVCQFGLAQSNTGFLAANRNSIEVSISPLLSLLLNTTGDPYDILYKRQFKNKNRAWRVGLLLNYNSDDYNNSSESIDATLSPTTTKQIRDNGETTSYTIGCYTGLEWQRVLGKRWLLAGGSDIGYMYNLSERTGEREDLLDYSNVLRESTVHSYSNRTDYTHTVSIHPFMGINFAITSCLAISTRFSLSFSYSFSKYSGNNRATTTTVYDIGEPYERYTHSDDSGSNNKFNIRLSPFQQINLTYSF